MPYTVAVANQKGGVAKTTTVASIAGALVNWGKRVLIVDLDAQADLTLAMGLNPGQMRLSVADLLLRSARAVDITQSTSIPGLDVLPSNSEMDSAERYLPLQRNYEFALRYALEDYSLNPRYDVILIDCPPYLGSVTLNALNAANLLIIPTQPEFFSAHALRNMMSVIRRVRAGSNPNLIYRILITMLDRRNRIHNNLREQIQETFGEGLLGTIIEVDTKLRESSIAGVPINYYKAKTRSALQYNALAQELNQYVEKTTAQTA